MTEEILEVTECTFVKGEMGKVVLHARGIDAIYITKALPNGDCEFTLAQDGPKMGSDFFKKVSAMILRQSESGSRSCGRGAEPPPAAGTVAHAPPLPLTVGLHRSQAMAMQLRTMKAFVEANAASISAEAPLDQLVEVAEHGAAQKIIADKMVADQAKVNA
jgi:hypothetical protein